MNERIQELAVQAGVTGYFASGTTLATPIPLSPEMQKFAELIVRECMKEVRDESQHAYNYKFADVVTERVFKHFGVAE